MRLIDAEELIEILIDRDFIKTSRQEDNARELLNLAPTVDAVSREEYDKLKDLCEQYKYERDVLEDAQRNKVEVVECAPIVDAVEIVRCKDCKYAEEEKTEHPYGVLCNHATVGGYGDVFDFMHYCSFGERKENVD